VVTLGGNLLPEVLCQISVEDGGEGVKGRRLVGMSAAVTRRRKQQLAKRTQSGDYFLQISTS
jgi:hypothetical protein